MGRPVYGIDLGTTYTKCAIVTADGTAQAVDLAGTASLRSVVALASEEGRAVAYVGAKTERFHGRKPDGSFRLIEEAKASIGMGADTQELDPPPWRFDPHQWEYLPEDIGALVLRAVKQIVDRQMPHAPLERAVITYPQRFEDTRREATRRAGEIAGLEVAGTITEPDAAAAFFGVEGSHPGDYMVFDLGGGTLDVTVVALREKRLEVRSSDGVHIGGRDFDRLLLRAMIEDYAARVDGFGESSLDAVTQRDWTYKAEQLKRLLGPGTQSMAAVDLQCIGELFEGPRVSFRLTRDRFEEMLGSSVARCIECADRALERAKLRWTDLRNVILVGGSSQLRIVRKRIEAVFGREPSHELDPTAAISCGAAVYGSRFRETVLPPRPSAAEDRESLHGALSLDFEYHGTLARGVGIKVWDRQLGAFAVANLVPQNMPIPHNRQQRFRTTSDGATHIDVELFEGELPSISECTPLGRCRIEGLPPGPKGAPVLVVIEIAENGTKTVRATHEPTGRAATARIDFAADRVVPRSDLPRRQAHIQSLRIVT